MKSITYSIFIIIHIIIIDIIFFNHKLMSEHGCRPRNKALVDLISVSSRSFK